MADDDEGLLGNWVKKSLEAGDDPEVIKAALKNQGHDSGIVDIVLKAGIMQKKDIPEKKLSIRKIYNSELKAEVEGILAPKKAESEAASPSGAPEQKTRSAEPPVSEAGASAQKPLICLPDFPSIIFRIKSTLANMRVPEFPKINISVLAPNPEASFRAVRYVMLIALFIALLAAALYGLNWYADRAAAKLFS